MKHLAAVALLLGMALPVCAQHGGASHGGGGGVARGGSGGGFSGHAAAPSFHSGFSASAPSRFAGGSRPTAPRQFAPRQFAPQYGGTPAYAANRARSFPPNYGIRNGAGRDFARPAYVRNGNLRDGRDWRNPHRPYRPIYQPGFVYGVPQYAGWIGPEYFAYPDDSVYDDGSSYPAYADNSGYAQPDTYQQPDDQEPPPPYEAPVEPMQRSAVPAPENAEAITLVFKDGRASEQIHNYILSRSTLSVLDGRQRDIPVDQLDLAATAKANRQAGVDFRLPASAQ